MSESLHDGKLDALLAESAWLRALARRLARDEASADDLEQETWIATLRSRPGRDAPLRPWLAAVLRNCARGARRASGRRDEHEQQRAHELAREGDERRASAPSSDELCARAELQRALLDEVLALDEPHRSTLLLRYYEGLEPAAIAARERVSRETVKSRLTRARERLRERLDRRAGGRAQWLAAFAPLALAPRVLPTAASRVDAARCPNAAPQSSAPQSSAPQSSAPQSSATQSSATQSSTPVPSALEPCSSAAPAAPSLPSSWTVWTGLLVMKTKLIVVCAIALVLALGYGWSRTSKQASAVDESMAAEPATIARATSGSSAVASSSRGVDAAREPVRHATPAQVAAASPATAAATSRLHARVYDSGGAPLANVALAFAQEDADPAPIALGASDVHGRLDVAAPQRAGKLVAGDAAWCTVMAGHWRPGAEIEPIVVLGPSTRVAGWVENEQSEPVVGARLELEMPADLRTRFDVVMDMASPQRHALQSGERGAFAFDALPLVSGARLRIEAQGYEAFALDEPSTPTDALVVRLRRPAARERLRGIVLDPSGVPIEDARVAFGIDTTRTDAQGHFEFALVDPRSFATRFGIAPRALTALAVGWLPVRYEPALEGGAPRWPEYVVLRLSANPPLAIAGKAYDAHGVARDGLDVWLADGSIFGAGKRGPAQLEGLLAGNDGEGWKTVETDADGRFRIEGLLDREYTLALMDGKTLLRVEVPHVRAGRSDVELRLPTDGLHALVAGRVVSRRGEPIANARIHPMCDGLRARFEGEVLSTYHSAVDGVRTDANGRFELHDVPKSLVYLRIDGEDVISLEYGRYVEGDARFARTQVRELPLESITRLEIEIDQRCHLSVELADPSTADAYGVLDAAGDAQILNVIEGESRREGERIELVQGRSGVVAVSDAGTTLVLFKNGVEVARRALELTPKRVCEVKL